MSVDAIDSWYEKELANLLSKLKESLRSAKSLREREGAVDDYKLNAKKLRNIYYDKTKVEIEKLTIDEIKNIKGLGSENKRVKAKEVKEYEDEILASRREIERLSREAEIELKKLEKSLVLETVKIKKSNRLEIKNRKKRIFVGKLKNRRRRFKLKYISPINDFYKKKKTKLNDFLQPYFEKIKEWVKLLK
ncbi:MAG: hypothetical protein ACLFN8_04975 [Candidatus Woesearchaeota archaeon]